MALYLPYCPMPLLASGTAVTKCHGTLSESTLRAQRPRDRGCVCDPSRGIPRTIGDDGDSGARPRGGSNAAQPAFVDTVVFSALSNLGHFTTPSLHSASASNVSSLRARTSREPDYPYLTLNNRMVSGHNRFGRVRWSSTLIPSDRRTLDDQTKAPRSPSALPSSHRKPLEPA